MGESFIGRTSSGAKISGTIEDGKGKGGGNPFTGPWEESPIFNTIILILMFFLIGKYVYEEYYVDMQSAIESSFVPKKYDFQYRWTVRLYVYEFSWCYLYINWIYETLFSFDLTPFKNLNRIILNPILLILAISPIFFGFYYVKFYIGRRQLVYTLVLIPFVFYLVTQVLAFILYLFE